MELNNRELALLIWLGVVIVGVLLAKSVRPAFLTLARSLFQRKIVDLVGLAALYTTACAWLLQRLGMWEWANLKTTILWFLTTAFVAMANTKALEKGPAILRQLAREAFTITAVVTFIGGMDTFPLWDELLLLPFLTLLTALIATAENMPENRIVLGPLRFLLTCAGLYVLGYSIYRVVIDWQHLDPAYQAREFGIPIALTLMFLPYLYGQMLCMGVEQAAIQLGFSVSDQGLRRYIWWRGAIRFGLNATKFARFVRAIQMADIHGREDVDRVLATMARAFAREKNPPEVSWSDGWSSFEARGFLTSAGLETEPYHPGLVDWSAQSPYLKLSDSYLADTLVYRISGTETEVTELDIELNARVGADSANSDAQFWAAACDLVLAVFGDETLERFAAAIAGDERASLLVGQVSVTVTRDDWSNGANAGYSRSLTVRHPAYDDPLPSLD